MGLFFGASEVYCGSAKLKKLQGIWQKTKKRIQNKKQNEGQLYFAFQPSLEVFCSSLI